MDRAARLSGLVVAVLALAACATSSPSAASVGPSSVPAASEPAVGAVCETVPKAFDPNDIRLTGAWAGDDGGIYYLRQVGSVLWWNGMSGRSRPPSDLGRNWNNVARGEISGLTISLEWADVPRGGILGSGTLNLSIEDDGTGSIQIVRVSETGEFGNRTWTPCNTPG